MAKKVPIVGLELDTPLSNRLLIFPRKMCEDAKDQKFVVPDHRDTRARMSCSPALVKRYEVDGRGDEFAPPEEGTKSFPIELLSDDEEEEDAEMEGPVMRRPPDNFVLSDEEEEEDAEMEGPVMRRPPDNFVLSDEEEEEDAEMEDPVMRRPPDNFVLSDEEDCEQRPRSLTSTQGVSIPKPTLVFGLYHDASMIRNDDPDISYF